MMKYNNRLRNWFFLLGVAILLIKCSSPAFPDEQMRIDPVLSDIYKAVASYDSIHFSNQNGNRQSIIIRSQDSTLHNSKGGFMEPMPSNYWTIKFEIAGYQKKPEQGIALSVNRDPTYNRNSFFITFPGFMYFTDTLPPLSTDTCRLNNTNISNYYRLAPNGNFEVDSAISFFYIDRKTGLLGFEMKNGDVWVNERIK